MAISPINLGSSFSSGGTSVLGGIASGLNAQSVINSLVASQSAQVTTLGDQVTVNNKQVSALSTMQQFLTQIQTAVSQLSNPQSPDSGSNVFASSSATITSNTTQAASNFMTATASAAAPAGTYTVSNITQLATQTTQQTGSFTVSPSTTSVTVASGAVGGQFNAGTITITGPAGNGDVTITAGQNLNQVADDFNAASGSTGLTATVQTTSPGVYTLAFTNSSTGDPVSFSLNNSSPDIVSDTSGVLATQTSGTFTLSAATNPFVLASGAAAGQFNAGTITLAGPKGNGTVVLNAGDTLSDVANDFNKATSSTGIAASVLQTAPGVYKLVFNSTATGSATLFDFTNSAATTLTSDTSGALSQISFQAMGVSNEGQDASFDLNGTTITRPTNTVSDLIFGVTLNLLQNTQGLAGASFTLQVAPDTKSIQTAVDNFAGAYNNFLTFYAQQTALGSNGTPASSAILYSDNTLRAVYNQLTSQVSSIVAGVSGSNQLSDIGLGFFNSPASSTAPAVANLLSVNDATLDSAISTNLSGLENVFGYNLNSSSPNLASFHAATNSTVPNFTLNVDQTSVPHTYIATYSDTSGSHTVNFTAATLGSGGVALTADPASALAGMILIYTGTGSESGISVSTTNGIAVQMQAFLKGALAANTGLLATDVTGIQTRNTTLQTQITSVTTQVANQREELLQKFSALEAAISQANSSLNLLNAQQQAASGG